MTQGEKQQTKMTEIIIFKIPKSAKEELEQFCKINGYNISGAVRMAIQQQIISPDLKTQSELWKILFAWTKDVEKWTKEVDEWRKGRDQRLEKVIDVLRGVTNRQNNIEQRLEILKQSYFETQQQIIESLKERPTKNQIESGYQKILDLMESMYKEEKEALKGRITHKQLEKVLTEYNERLTGILQEILALMREKNVK